ncbi:MAG: hypothetical protein ACXWZI_11855 [Mycobacterium sp.]
MPYIGINPHVSPDAAGVAAIVVGATIVTTFTTAPTAAASAAQFCDGLAGVWDGTNCVTTVESNRNARMTISLALPDGLLDNPTAGPVLRQYYSTGLLLPTFSNRVSIRCR